MQSVHENHGKKLIIIVLLSEKSFPLLLNIFQLLLGKVIILCFSSHASSLLLPKLSIKGGSILLEESKISKYIPIIKFKTHHFRYISPISIIMCNETRINTKDLQINMVSAIPPQESAVASEMFGVTSTSSGKKEHETLLNTIPDMQQQQQEDDEDPHDTMITFLTGRTKSERSSKERAIIFPVKVSSVSPASFCSLAREHHVVLYPRIFFRLNG